MSQSTASRPVAAGRGPGGPPDDPALVRTLVLVGHTGSGKTTLVETLLAAAGAITRPGTVDEGTTVTDHDEAARRQHRSVSLAVASFQHDGLTVNLVDTPGHPDYVGELRAGLRAADAALFVVSATDGLDGATALVWEECASLGLPRAVVVTKLDQPRADFDESVAVCQRVFGEGVVPVYLPLLGDDDTVAGLIGLLSQQVIDYSSGTREVRQADAEHLELIEGRRAELIEAVIQESEDDTLMDRYLAGDDIDETGLIADLERAVARGSFYPVLPIASAGGVGTQELLRLLTKAFPSPLERPMPAVTTPDGAPCDVPTCDPDGPLLAQVVKTTSDPYVGRISLVRVFSGTLRPDTVVHVSGHGDRFQRQAREGHEDHDVDERVGALSSPLGATLRPIEQCSAGNVCVVAKLTRAETGDTLSDPERPRLIEPWVLPEPLLPVAIHPHSPSDEDKLAESLARLTLEDSTIRVEHDQQTGQLLLWAMGEAHVSLALDRLSDRYGVHVDAIAVRVQLRETVTSRAEGRGRLVKQSGGHGQYAVCEMTVEPLPTGSGIEFAVEVVGGAVPKQYLGSVEKGVRARAEKGVLAGYPVTDVKVTLTGGKAHSVDSSDAAFASAGGLAFEEAVRAASPILLEPVHEVLVVADDEFVGAVMSDLSARRGRVTGTEPLGNGRSQVRADVPATSLGRYAVELRSIAHGTGTFTREYARHEPMPAHVADKVLDEMRSAPA
ncbi:MAG TPA: elongation factor G-like protein EF-G2 [Actinomycetales bacterium]|nr:elongation factor G-like protein EF-G2 [Actinomycetales bacterium]